MNFKQLDFINYKLIKYYIFKDNFIEKKSLNDLHAFNFLFFFKKVGGKKGVELSKKNIFLWYKKYKNYYNFPWISELTARRFLNIVYNYDFIFSISKKKEIQILNNIIIAHQKRLIFEINRKKKQNISSVELVAYVLCKCISNENKKKNLEEIQDIVDSQTDEIGMHKSYNILQQGKFINDLNEIKNILLYFKYLVPKTLNNKILSMTSILSQYNHEDGSLPLFNGCNNNHLVSVSNIKKNEQFLKKRSLKGFVNGLAFYKDLNKSIFFDVIQPTKYSYSKELNASTLSFEISAFGEKIITNCGGSESGGKNPGYLKYSAAHSTIIINNTNISEIKEGGPNTEFPKKVMFEMDNDENTLSLCGTHNGYLKNYKKICKRKLKINKKKNVIDGEDTIISSNANTKKTIYHIRFHLMPDSSITITKNEQSAIIKTKKNHMWVFKSNKKISIENSIYVQNDVAKETKQIVISEMTSKLKNIIKWSLEKI